MRDCVSNCCLNLRILHKSFFLDPIPNCLFAQEEEDNALTKEDNASTEEDSEELTISKED